MSSSETIRKLPIFPELIHRKKTIDKIRKHIFHSVPVALHLVQLRNFVLVH